MNSDIWWLLGVGIWLTLVWIATQLTSLDRRREEQASHIFKDGAYQPRPETPTTKMLCGYQASRPINPKGAPKGDPLLKSRSADSAQPSGAIPPAPPSPPRNGKPPAEPLESVTHGKQ